MNMPAEADRYSRDDQGRDLEIHAADAGRQSAPVLVFRRKRGVDATVIEAEPIIVVV